MTDLKGKILAGKVLVQPKEAEKKTNPNKVISDKLKSYDDNISDKLLGEVFKV